MNERESFERMIEEDKYDQDTRLVYSDWLEEHGFDDEALIQRQWTREKQMSEDWLRNFAARLCEEEHNLAWPESEHDCISYEDVMAAAKRHLAAFDSEVALVGGTLCLPFDTPDFVHREIEQFWEHYKTVNELELPENFYGVFVRCAC